MRDWGSFQRLFTVHGLIYRTGFYRSLGFVLPEHVYYDDAYFDVVYASRASVACIAQELLYVYRIGDHGQSVSRKSRERRIHELETVLLKICETQKTGSGMSKAGMHYWYYRTASFLTDYYVTAFLRFQDRKKGRAAARHFSGLIKAENQKLYRMCRNKYWLLYGMSLLHGKEEWLDRYLKLRDRFRASVSAEKPNKLIKS